MKDTCYRFLSLAINFQLLFSPLAIGQAVGTGDGLSSTGSKVGNTVRDAANIAGGLLGASGGGMQSMMNPNMLELSLVDPGQLPPAVVQAGCGVYVAQTNSPDRYICDPSRQPGPQTQSQIEQILTSAQNNIEALDVHLREGHESITSQGAVCFNKAAKQLQTLFKSQEETLNQFQKRIEDHVKNFRKDNEQLLTEIYKGDALINGDKAQYKDRDLLANFDFGRQFSKNAACATTYTEDEIRTMGKGGYKNIDMVLKNKVDKSDSPKTYSPEEVFSKEAAIKRDVRNLVKGIYTGSVAKNAASLDAKSLTGFVTPRELDLENPKIKSLLSEEIANYNERLTEKKQMIDPKYSAMLEAGNYNSKTVGAIFERDQYNACLTRYTGSVSKFLSSISNPTVDNRNNGSDSTLKKTINENLLSPNVTVEKKISDIKRLDNGSEKVLISSSREVCGKWLAGNTWIGVTDLLKLYQCECDNEFKRDSGNGRSQAMVANHVKNFDKQLKEEKSRLRTKVHERLEDEMLSCPTENSIGSAKLSCQGALDKNSPDFCLRTAKVCAGNAKACLNEANKMLATTIEERQGRANVYNAKMKSFKQLLANEMGKQMQLIENSMRTMDSQYGPGSVYNTPLGLELNQLSDQLLSDLDTSLNIEDVEKYLATAQDDIKKIKAQLKKSQEELFGMDPNQFKDKVNSGMADQGGFLGKLGTYLKNAEIERERWKKIQSRCDKASIAVAQMNSQQQQNQMQTAQMCEQAKAFSGLSPCNEIVPDIQNMLGVADADNGGNSQDYFAKFCNGQDDAVLKIAEDNLAARAKKINDFCNENKSECGNKTFCTDLSQRVDLTSPNKYCIDSNLFKLEPDQTCKNTPLTVKQAIVGLSEEDFLATGFDLKRDGSDGSKVCVLPGEEKVIADNAYRYSVNKGMLAQASKILTSDVCKGIQTTEARTGEKDTGNYGFGRYLGSVFNDGLGGGTAKR